MAIVFDVTVKEYLREIDQADLLTWEQEQELAKNIQIDNDPESRDILIRSNLRLVVNIAKSFSGPSQTFGDLIEEGNLGLMRAVDSFDPEHGVRFSTYAAWWIRQAIKQSILSNSQILHIPTYMVDLLNHYRGTIQRLEAKLGTAPTVEQISKEMKLPLRKVEAIAGLCDSVRPGMVDGDDEAPGLEETLCDERTKVPGQSLVEDELLVHAVELLDQLEERQAEILRRRFGLDRQEPEQLKDIAESMNLTHERVRQLQHEGLRTLHELLSD